MYSGLARHIPAVLLGAAVVTGLSTAATEARAATQPAAKAAAPLEKDLEGAAGKVREGKVDEAFSLIKEQAAKHPEWPPPRLILARLLFSANQVGPGRQALEQAAAEAPEFPDIYLNLGQIALGEGRFSDARLNFEYLLSLLASGHWKAEKVNFLRREALAGLATVAEARDDWKTAGDRLNAWLEIEPKNGHVRQRLARSLFRLGKTDDAFAALTQAVKDEPALEPAAVSMAFLQSQKGDFKKADEWFDRAQKHEPNNPRVRLARAAWLVDQGRSADARRDVDAALKLDPGSKDAQKIRALVAWHLRDLATAEAILEPLHRDAPADSAIANLLALALVDQDDAHKRSRGIQLADVNALQFPRSAEVVATLGWALFRAGRLDEAEQKLRTAVAGGRTTPDIAYFRARVLAEKGQTAEARKLLELATNTRGAFAHRDDANSLLKTLTK